jgi:hypothetical protein
LSYAIDTDNGGYRYINPVFGQDITADIISVILYPERPLREVVEVVEVAADSIATEEIPTLPVAETATPVTETETETTGASADDANEKEISVAGEEKKTDDTSSEGVADTRESVIEQAIEAVLEAESEEADSIINK